MTMAGSDLIGLEPLDWIGWTEIFVGVGFEVQQSASVQWFVAMLLVYDSLVQQLASVQQSASVRRFVAMLLVCDSSVQSASVRWFVAMLLVCDSY